jgi:hypothetical protein
MDSDKNQYTEDDLRQLEQRIDELIDTVSLLKNGRVEAMISRLRSLELGS